MTAYAHHVRPVALRERPHMGRRFTHLSADVDILFRDGRIAALGHSLPRGEGTRILDCSSGYVLPGLIDCHVHLTSGGEAGDLTRRDPIATRAFEAANNASRTLMAGFTTVRDLGAPEQLNIHLARAIQAGTVSGPTILAAGLGVTMTGGHGHGFIAREADGPDEVRKAVREQLRAGAGAIKLFASGGVLTPGVDPRSPSFTEGELRAGVEEGHKAFRAGVKLAMGTDRGTPLNRPGENAQEIARMVRAGLSPAAAILAATAWAADLLRVDAGRLVEGLHGDAVVFASDPLMDISGSPGLTRSPP